MSSQLPTGQQVRERYFDGTTTSIEYWFLDLCYRNALAGYDFPAFTRYGADLSKIIAEAERLLVGNYVDAIRISRTTRGQSPLPLRREDVEAE